MLPKNEKIKRITTNQMKLWIYGEPTIGKTIFANKFPNVLFLNTDGNIKYVDSPSIAIAPIDGKDAWEVFLDNVTDILKGNHEFETIVVDLLEDVYQYCRAYYAKKLKIEHEGDLGFGKGYDIIRNAFLMTIKALTNSKYNIILVSHEKAVSVKDRIGREMTRFQPAITESLAGKISGMVDITGRVTIKSEEKNGEIEDIRILYLDATKDQTGGNRIPGIKDTFIPLEYTNLLNVYKASGDSR